ncbi:murein biosynthesis integral membrane protein MurJ [Pedococcus sp. 5OH_020]|uniref:murein biosynthesis integral membrane protein MurJ n=1 Tax=Pedococcus sp. 5OH_020 TaxID=2989814 RepID=UPI0022E9C70F|nr:lipid II flippase MurJ [Pedococcus sp. 5OH_020]
MTVQSVRSSVARAAGLIALATLLARLTGFVRTLVFSGSVGAAGVGDTYQSVNMLPNVVYEVAAGGVLAAVAVPLVAGQLGRGRAVDADRTASALLTWAVLVLAPLTVVLAIGARWVGRALLGSSASQAELTLASHMLVLFAPQVLLYGVGIVLTGVLQAHRRFLAAALAPLLSSVVVIGSYLAYAAVAGDRNTPGTVSRGAVWTLAGGTTLGVVMLSLPLLAPVLRAGVRLRPTLQFPAGTARRAASLAGAGVLALLAQQAAVLTTLWVTHHRTAAVGTVNVYTYVQAVYLLPYAVLAVPVATSAFPALAHAVASDSRSAATSRGTSPEPTDAGHDATVTLAGSLRGVLLLTAGAAAVLMAVSRPVGGFFSALDRGRQAGGGAALEALPGTLSAYAPGVVGFGVAALLTRALYVRGRPLYAALAVATGWVLSAALPLLAVPEGSTAGATLGVLGVSSTLGMTVSAVLLTGLVRQAWGRAALTGSGRTLAAALVAMAFALAGGDALATRVLALVTTGSASGALLGGALVALVTAAIYLAVMAVADRRSMVAIVQRSRQRRSDGPV